MNSFEEFHSKVSHANKKMTDRGKKSHFLSVDVVASGNDAWDRGITPPTARMTEGNRSQEDVSKALNSCTTEPPQPWISFYGLSNLFVFK